MKKCLFILLVLSCFQKINAQEEATYEFTPAELEILDKLEDTLSLLSFAVINDSLPENRFGACRRLIPTLVKALKTKNSFKYQFERLKSVSIQYPRDSSFRIFTWQLYVDIDDYRYYGAIQMNDSDLKLFPLVDRSFNIDELEYEILSPENWYGAVYYNLMQFESPQGPKYLLFGFDGFSFFQKRKLIDVLSFVDGKPKFGAPVFVSINDKSGIAHSKNRLVMQYSSEASMRLNYDNSLKSIIYDHLETMGGNYDQGPVQVPDGTYEGYVLNNGNWVHVPKMFHEVLDEAPRPEPILDGRKGNGIMGKSKVN